MPIVIPVGPDPEMVDPAGGGVTWIGVDSEEAEDRAWLTAWLEIGDQTRALLLEPMRFSHRADLSEGVFLSLRTMRTGATDDIDHLADLKLLIGRSRMITVRSGEVAAVDERRQLNSVHQLLSPIVTDPALHLDSDDRETRDRSANHVPRYLESLDESRSRVLLMEAQIDAPGGNHHEPQQPQSDHRRNGLSAADLRLRPTGDERRRHSG